MSLVDPQGVSRETFLGVVDPWPRAGHPFDDSPARVLQNAAIGPIPLFIACGELDQMASQPGLRFPFSVEDG